MKRKPVALHIEELALRGFAREEGAQVGEAIQRELARLFAEGGLPPALAGGGELERLHLGSFKAARGEKADAIGTQLARKVYDGISGGAKK